MTTPNDDDNVIPFKARAVAKHTMDEATESKPSRATRKDHIRAHASTIRDEVSGFQGKLTSLQRLTLAQNLGAILQGGQAKRPRGWRTQVLTRAGVSRKEEHTKRWARFVRSPDRKAGTTEQLSARPTGYLKIAEAFAEIEALDADEIVVQAFRDVHLMERQDEGFTAEDITPYVPLCRLLTALVEGPAIAKPAADYFKDLGRWGWSEGGYGPLVWFDERNPFEPGPEEQQFYSQRLALLPKVRLFSELDFDLTLSLGSDYSIQTPPESSVGTLLLLNPVEIRADFGLWLVLCPLGPGGRIVPYFAWLWRIEAEGTCEIDGEIIHYRSERVPGDIVSEDDAGTLQVSFPIDNLCSAHLKADTDSRELAEDVVEKFSRAERRTTELDPVTPISVHRHLGEIGDPIRLMTELDWSATGTSAPISTIGSFLEGWIREDEGVSLQKSLKLDLERLVSRMASEIERHETELAKQEQSVIDRLTNESTDTEEGDNA